MSNAQIWTTIILATLVALYGLTPDKRDKDK